MRKLLIVFAAWTVVAAACARQQADPTTTTSSSTTSSSTTTTTQATTTTTVFSVELGEAPPRLERLVTSVYAYATGEGGRPDRVPAPLLPEPDPDRRLRPLEGKAAVTTYRGVRVAVVQVGKDVLGAVDNGSGWRIVAGRLPSLG